MKEHSLLKRNEIIMGTKEQADRTDSESVQLRSEEVSYVYTAKQLIDYETKEVPMLLDPLFPKVGVVALAGSSDTGKSAFLRQLACAIATAKSEFLGFRLDSKHHNAIYVSTEDDKLAISALLQKQTGNSHDR